jgi:murein DD-endopeptidase MepM/ murein hydrolase activator NlpD
MLMTNNSNQKHILELNNKLKIVTEALEQSREQKLAFELLDKKINQMFDSWSMAHGLGGRVNKLRNDINHNNLENINKEIEELPYSYNDMIISDKRHLLKNYSTSFTYFKFPLRDIEDSNKISQTAMVTCEFGPGYLTLKTGESYLTEYRMHTALDIQDKTDNRIFASADGYVYLTGWNEFLGNFILLHHKINNQSYLTLYGHLKNVYVKKDDIIDSNTIIGQMGDTGSKKTGIHVHWGLYIWINNGYYAINPVKNSTYNTNICNTECPNEVRYFIDNHTTVRNANF